MFAALTPEEIEKREAAAARAMEPLTDAQIEEARLAYAEHGVTDHLWSSLHPDSKRNACTYYRNDGRLHDVLTTTLPFQQDAPAVKVHPDLTVPWNNYTLVPGNTYFCITNAEEWWPLAPSFLADTPATILQLCIYKSVKVRGDKSFLKHLPTSKRPPGRPPSAEVALRKETDELYKQQYREWREACALRKEVLEGLHADYKQALARAEELRVVWKNAEAEGAPLMPRRNT